MRSLALVWLAAMALLLTACGQHAEPDAVAPVAEPPDAAAEPAEKAPDWAIFPADRSLQRPEDGELLEDGRLILADQVHGLVLVAEDGSSRAFGDFAKAGYRHAPPEQEGGPNGVSLSPDGRYLLVADVFGGGIYRVDVASEATERVYQHEFGVNTAIADASGGIWFTQSTTNLPADGAPGLFSAADVPREDGAVFYLPASADKAERRVEGLRFANGLALDASPGLLYVAETMGNRVLRFALGEDGALGERAVLIEVMGPDNLELAADGRLWIALPISNQIMRVDTATGAGDIAFGLDTPDSTAQMVEIQRRLAAGESWLALMSPTLWAPAPGLMTGVILAPDGGVRYWTGIGDGVIRFANDLD